MSASWPTSLPVEALLIADDHIEAYALVYDAMVPALGDVLRNVWQAVRPAPTCDCPVDPHHRWNCPLTPIWAQTIRDLDTNPWTLVRDVIDYCPMPGECPICGTIDTHRFAVDEYDTPICQDCWIRNRHLQPEAWHCADCGRFIAGMDRMCAIVGGYALMVCPEHFSRRATRLYA